MAAKLLLRLAYHVDTSPTLRDLRTVSGWSLRAGWLLSRRQDLPAEAPHGIVEEFLVQFAGSGRGVPGFRGFAPTQFKKALDEGESHS